ncbi:hypothetical protein [Bacteroides salyersiae]|uniref:hypothetical protein n=1 Tax=Bacteroides salyersiae TaxID=291644 RepID=UPI001898B51F|nr:hypothetical protein [Bacteroides salyersiae]
MAEEHLMTVEEFNQAVRGWTLRVKSLTKQTLDSNTKATGHLSNYPTYLDRENYDSPYYKIKFHFERYGVFRAYGAGRGYVIVNGVPVRGYRVRSDSDIKKRLFGGEAKEMLENGYRTREINVAKKIAGNQNVIRRTPLNWFDKHINQNIKYLADVAQGFYGDEALRQILSNFHKLKIIKKQ